MVLLTMKLGVMAISKNYHEEQSSVANITKCISSNYNPRQYEPNPNNYHVSQRNGPRENGQDNVS